jgi:hypothetical protein
MAYVCLEVKCSPTGEEKFPVPTTIRIARIFADAADAAKSFPSDQIIKADAAYAGQDVCYLLWKTDEPLNIDRCVETGNVISNCGMWLPADRRIYGETCDLSVELVPPARLIERQRQRAAAQRVAEATEAHMQRKRGSSAKAHVENAPMLPENDDAAYSGTFHGPVSGIASAPGAGAAIRQTAHGLWAKRY